LFVTGSPGLQPREQKALLVNLKNARADLAKRHPMI